MKVVTDLSQYQPRAYPNLVVALGNFDGLHLGHERLIKLIRSRAKELHGTAAVFTFREHPQRVLHGTGEPKILTSLTHKLELIKTAGIELCFLIDFTLPFSRKSAEEFILEIFRDRLRAKVVCLGFNARFGRNREGDRRLIEELGRTHGFESMEAPLLEVRNEVVSSSKIRALISEARFKEARTMLGHPYSFFGKVVKGSGRGSRIGFPTANLDPQSEVMPPHGVYAVRVRTIRSQFETLTPGLSRFEHIHVDNPKKAVMNFGTRPTFTEDSSPVPEIHILDCDQDLRGKTLEVEVVERLRDEKKFATEDELKQQIENDIEIAKDCLENEVAK